jgi:hypothetical protein
MRCPLAKWAGSPNFTLHQMTDHRGLVLHVEQGTEAGTHSWFQNPAAQASAHFGCGRDGSLEQFVDTDDLAWAEMTGNASWLSVELEGYSGQPMTEPQLTAVGQLFGWITYSYPNVPLQICDDPWGRGLGWHGMGGSSWGNHPDCPGDPIKAQRTEILRRTRPQVVTTQGGVMRYDPPLPVGPHSVAFVVTPSSGGAYCISPEGNVYAWGCKDIGAPARNPGYWGNRTVLNVVPNGNGFTVFGQLDGKPDGKYAYPA